jgi:hypothetical protein
MPQKTRDDPLSAYRKAGISHYSPHRTVKTFGCRGLDLSFTYWTDFLETRFGLGYGVRVFGKGKSRTVYRLHGK